MVPQRSAVLAFQFRGDFKDCFFPFFEQLFHVGVDKLS